MTNAAYYYRFKTRVDVAEHIGVSIDNPVLWDLKSQELYIQDYDSLIDTDKEKKVKEDENLLAKGITNARISLEW